MRRVLPVSFSVSCLALLLALVVGLVVWWGGRDVAPPDMSDLTVAANTLPTESNAYVQMLAACEDLTLSPADRNYLARSAKLREWNLVHSAEILTTNEMPLVAIDAALAQADYAEPLMLHVRDQAVQLGPWREMAQLKSLQIQAMLWDHDAVGALREALQLAQFGQRAQVGCGSIVGYLVAGSVRLQGVWMAQVAALSAPELSTAQAQALIAELGELMPSQAAASRAMRVEAMVQHRTIAALASGEGVGAPRGRAISRYALHPHRTQQALADSMRGRLSDLGAPLPEPDAATQPEVPGWRRQLQANGVGRQMLELLSPSYDRFFRSFLADRAYVEAVRVAVAFRAFSLAEARAPATLEELVPLYLPAVPTDPFDGAPLRYDPERRLVYSIGVNGTDDGGRSRLVRGSPSLNQDDIVVGLMMAHYVGSPKEPKGAVAVE